METAVFEITAADAGARLDSVLCRLLAAEYAEDSALYSRNYVQKLIADGGVRLNGVTVVKSVKAKEGDRVEADLPDPVPLDALPEDIPLDVVYEDYDLLVVDKPKGMVVHPAPGNMTGTLVNALLFHCGDSLSGVNGVQRPGIVHRIDKDTSGLLVVAKNDAAHNSLSEQIAAHTVTRRYFAVVYGHFREPEGIVDAPIGRSQNDRKRFAVTDRNSKKAVTHYRVLEELEGFSFVECRLETGRTHQIRCTCPTSAIPWRETRCTGPERL